MSLKNINNLSQKVGFIQLMSWKFSKYFEMSTCKILAKESFLKLSVLL